MDRIECPSCGAVADLPPMRRSADEFCTSCDFPLFWARPDERYDLGDDEAAEDRALAAVVRRRPGAAGRQVLVGEPCPACSELNTPQAVYCHRCGADMHPPPPPPPTPEAEEPAAPVPVPVTEDSTPPLWLVAAVGVLAALLTVQLLVLLLRTG